MTDFIPNSYQTPNALVDEVMYLLTSEEWRVLSYAVRHILGFQESLSSRMRRLSISVFEKGYASYPGCGLKRPTIIKALEGLHQFGLLQKVGKSTNDGQMYKVAFGRGDIQFEALKARWQGWQDVAERRTVAGRKAKQDKRQEALGGLSDRLPEAVCATDQQRSVGQTASGLSDRHNKTHSQTHLQTQEGEEAPAQPITEPTPEIPLSLSKPETERDVIPLPVSEVRKVVRDAFTLQNTLNPVIETYLSCFTGRQQNRSIRTSEKAHESAERIAELFTLDEVKALVIEKRKTNSGYPFAFLEGDLAQWAAEKESPASLPPLKTNGVPPAPKPIGDAYRRIVPGKYKPDGSAVYEDELGAAS